MTRSEECAHLLSSTARSYGAVLMLSCIVVGMSPRPAVGDSPTDGNASDRADFAKVLDEKPEQIYTAIQMALGRFGYGVAFGGSLDTPTREALRRFQLRHGLNPTGLPDYESVTRILDYVSALDRPVYALPSKSFSATEEPYMRVDGSIEHRLGRFHAEGAWEMTRGDAQYWKQSLRDVAVEIECERESQESFERISIGHCYEKTAEISSLFGIDVLLSREKYFRVAHWDENGIITVPDPDGCFEFTMRILFPAERVTKTRVIANKTSECQKNPNDVEVELMDGTNVTSKLRDEKMKTTREVMLVSPTFYDSGF